MEKRTGDKGGGCYSCLGIFLIETLHAFSISPYCGPVTLSLAPTYNRKATLAYFCLRLNLISLIKQFSHETQIIHDRESLQQRGWSGHYGCVVTAWPSLSEE